MSSTPLSRQLVGRCSHVSAHAPLFDGSLVPVYDLLHHRGGKVDVASQREPDGALAVRASTDVRAGETVWNTLAPAKGMSAIDVFHTYG